MSANGDFQTPFEQWLTRTARDLPVPPVPDPQPLMTPTRSRWLSPSLATVIAVVILIAGLLLVPPVRATLREWLTIGAVSISLDPTAATPAPPAITNDEIPPGATATTLAEAETALGFSLDPPADLGPPSAVYLYDELGGMATLLWPADDLLLHVIDQNMILTKIGPQSYAEPAAVNDQIAYWVSGQRRLDLYDQTMAPIEGFARMIEGPVLIWTIGETTFRLETTLPRAEAIALAERLIILDEE